ncbi:MAG: type II toxin-antitoxin system Phd/YefM family antitoxin [Desulfopila sp.]
MSHLNIADAKANFSKLVDRALLGEEVIIARDNRPLVKLVPIESPPKARQPGSGKGQILEMSDDFDQPIDDMKEYM